MSGPEAGPVNVAAGSAYVISQSDFGFSDALDSPADTLTRNKITSLPTAGSLRLNGNFVSAGQFVSETDLAAGRLTFIPPAARGQTLTANCRAVSS